MKTFRFAVADQDRDGKLSKKEYTDFVHPEESLAMREIVIDETLDDIDENDDGVIDFDGKLTTFEKSFSL